VKVLHIPYTWTPDPIGGTEHYVRALVTQLRPHGIDGTIAAPGERFAHTWRDGLEVFRFPGGSGPHAAEGVPDPVAATAFRRILEQQRPAIVHLHAHTAAVSVLLLEAARQFGARTVVTYHTPTLSCARGTLLLDGVAPCDGLLRETRCTACMLRRHQLPDPLPPLLARLPVRLGHGLQRVGLRRGPFLALRMRQIVSDHIARVHRFLAAADCIVAPCHWVEEALLANCVPKARLRLCRQGLAHPLALDRKDEHDSGTQAEPGELAGSTTLRIGCFGRLDSSKGMDVLTRAVRRLPAAALELRIHGIGPAGADSHAAALRRLATGDPRIRFLPPLSPEQVLAAMARLDLVAVPSIWLETGPLVVLEAFAAGTPVLGSDRGGIAELVRSGVDGLLLPAGDVAAWAGALEQLVADRAPLRRWRGAIRPPRTMAIVASEMSAFYREIIKRHISVGNRSQR
jgi:glycosyltransferase involved in cell wall biosynthesis